MAIIGVAAVFIYRLLTAPRTKPRTANPWGEDIEEALHREDAVPLCCRCLAPQQHTGWFCAECGATVGPYANWMPYIYVFAQGELLRTGTTERIRRRPLVIFGFILFSMYMFSVFAPVYWYCLVRNLERQNRSPDDAEHTMP